MVFSFHHKSSCGDTKKTPGTDWVCVCLGVVYWVLLQKWEMATYFNWKVSAAAHNGRWKKGKATVGKALFPLLERTKGCVSSKESKAEVILKGPCPRGSACWTYSNQRARGQCLGWSWTGESGPKASQTMLCLHQKGSIELTPKVNGLLQNPQSCPAKERHVNAFPVCRLLRAQAKKNSFCLFFPNPFSTLWF